MKHFQVSELWEKNIGAVKVIVDSNPTDPELSSLVVQLN